MKTIVFLSIMTLSCSSFAWTSRDAAGKEYTFKYKLSGTTLEIKRTAPSYEDAYEQAAQQCFNYFKNGQRVSESRGLDIIDVCANPRS